jgi:predicted amidophosphoribosyltransferase
MGLQKTSITYNNSLYTYYYLCHYLPLSAGADTLSRSLLKFKRSIRPDLHAWIDCTLEVFHNIPLSPGTIILRALRHDETRVHESPPSALDLLGQSLAASFQCQYLPSLLCKSRPTLSNKGLTRDQRETELNDVYSIAQKNLPPHPTFLLIDDILTTGTTIRTIIHTLHQAFPLSPLQVFTLAKADNDPDLNRSSPPHSQNYHLEEDAGWIIAEEPAPYTPVTPAETPFPDQLLHDLKNSIRTNFE